MYRRYFLSCAILMACLPVAALVFWAPGASVGATQAFQPIKGQAGEPQWGFDVRVNSLSGDKETVQRNFALAVDPTNPNRLLAGFDTHQISIQSAYASSTDGGRTWANGLFPGPWTSDSLDPFGNIGVAFDGTGVGYYTSQAITNTLSGYFVLTTTNGTQWSAPAPVVVSDYSQYRHGAYLAVDPRVSGTYARRLYMFWLYTTSTEPYLHGISMRYSSDGGATWSNDIQVSSPGHEYAFSPSAFVAADGTVYAAFEQLDNYFIGNRPKLYLNRSTDGGVTWGPDRLISGAPVTPIGGPDWKNRELTLIGSRDCGLIRINHFPSIVASPLDSQTVYAVWNDGRWDGVSNVCDTGSRHSDIAFSRSTDGGQTWTPAARLGNDPIGSGIDQFQPIISIRSDGLLGVTWYDRRYDPAGFLYDLVYTQSSDGGLSWSPDRRVSDVSSNPDAAPDVKGIDDLGFRRGQVFGPDFVMPTWLDTRRGFFRGDFYTDQGVFTFSSPTATPGAPTNTSVPTHTHTITPTRTVTRSPTATRTPSQCAPAFNDVSTSDWFYEYVSYLYCQGIISGYSDNTFRPYNPTTRGQLAKIVTLAESWPVDLAGAPHFADVPPGSPFYEYVETAYNRQVVSGYTCGAPGEPCPGLYFRWGSDVTRGQLCKIVVLAEGWDITTAGGPHFADVPPGSPFYEYVETAYNRQIVSGYSDGTFRWGSNATRAQISKIVYNAITQP
jgi:hypothetical protein